MNKLFRGIIILLFACFCKVEAYCQIDVNMDINEMVKNAKQQKNKAKKSKKKNSAGETLNLYGCDFQYVKETGSLEVTINKDEAGNVLGLDFGNESGFAVGTKPSYLYNIIFPGITAVKN